MDYLPPWHRKAQSLTDLTSNSQWSGQRPLYLSFQPQLHILCQTWIIARWKERKNKRSSTIKMEKKKLLSLSCLKRKLGSVGSAGAQTEVAPQQNRHQATCHDS